MYVLELDSLQRAGVATLMEERQRLKTQMAQMGTHLVKIEADLAPVLALCPEGTALDDLRPQPNGTITVNVKDDDSG